MPQGPSDGFYPIFQQQLDRRFNDLKEEMNRRFTTVDHEIQHIKDHELKDIQTKIDKLEDGPRDSFRIYVAPVIVAIVTAIIISFLVKQGVTAR